MELILYPATLLKVFISCKSSLVEFLGSLMYTKFYSVVKNNDILNFACKCMDIENALLSKVSQTQKEEYGMYSLISGF